MMSLMWSIYLTCLRRSARTMIVDDRRTYTGGQLLAAASFVAEHLDSRTGNPHVGILLPTSGAFPIALLGTWHAGRVAVPLNYLLNRQELALVVMDSGIDAVVTTQLMLDFLGEDALPRGIQILRIEDIPFDASVPWRWPVATEPDALAALLYTSGTSGTPKGVMLTHRNLEANVNDCVRHVHLSAADTFLGVLPQFHSFGFTANTLLPLRCGATVIYTARFIPRRIVELIRRHQPDVFLAVPSMYAGLLSVKEAGPEDFRSVRIPVSGGEPLPAALRQQCRERFGLNLLEGYGLTETAPVTHWLPPTLAHKHGSVGPALPSVRTLVVDEQLKPLPTGQDGEILLHGPNVMAGYYHRHELDEEVFLRLKDPADGQNKRFLRTGDIGHIDADGCLFITGRKKEMLIVGGENVFPREIEEVLDSHPSVNASAVIGRQDDVRGEVPVAFVEPTEGSTVEETELRTLCRDRLAGFKVPRDIRVVEKLPRSPTGKILRRQLRW